MKYLIQIVQKEKPIEVSGNIHRVGEILYGIHYTGTVWIISELSTGLKIQSFKTRKQAEAALKDDETTGKVARHFQKPEYEKILEEQRKRIYDGYLETTDRELVKTFNKLYS